MRSMPPKRAKAPQSMPPRTLVEAHQRTQSVLSDVLQEQSLSFPITLQSKSKVEVSQQIASVLPHFLLLREWMVVKVDVSYLHFSLL